MALWWLLFISYGFAEDNLIEEELEQNKVKAIAHPLPPKTKVNWKTFFIGCGIGGFLLYFVPKIFKIFTTNAPSNPPSNPEESLKTINLNQEFFQRFKSNIEEKLNQENLKNFYKVLMTHYVFGDLWMLLFLMDYDRQQPWTTDMEKKFQEKYAFGMAFNKIIEEVFKKFNKKNNIWSLNGENFQKFMDDEPNEEVNKSINLLKGESYNLATYTVIKNNIPIHWTQILSPQIATKDKFEAYDEIYASGVDNLTSIENLFAMDILKAPSDKILKIINEEYWPFIESRINTYQENFALLKVQVDDIFKKGSNEDYSLEEKKLWDSYDLALATMAAYRKNTKGKNQKNPAIDEIMTLLSNNFFDLEGGSINGALLNIMTTYLRFLIKNAITFPWTAQDKDDEKNQILLEYLTTVGQQ
jgi:hypothetical protein